MEILWKIETFMLIFIDMLSLKMIQSIGSTMYKSLNKPLYFHIMQKNMKLKSVIKKKNLQHS